MESLIAAFSNPIVNALPRIPAGIIAFIVGYIVMVVVKAIIGVSLRLAKAPRSVIQIMMSVVNVVAWVLLLAAVLYALGLGQLALALSGSLAVIGFALATGANVLVADVLAGLFLSRDSNFNVGYRIKMGDLEGIVERIDLRKVRMRDQGGKIHVVPNAVFDKTPWVVLDVGEK